MTTTGRTPRPRLAPLVATFILWGTPATAQADGGSSTDDTGLEQVVVTAQKREQSIQDVPIAVSAFSGEQLRSQQIDTTDQLAHITPNLSFNSSGAFAGTKSAAQVFIRGVGQVDYLPVTDPGVGIYVDGIYMARSIGAVMQLLDIDRVEVLRGPQGTLFGRNAGGGVVALHSRRPDDQPRRSIRAQLGSDRMTNVTVVASDRLADRLSAGTTLAYRRRDGYVSRVQDGLDLGDDDTKAVRGSLVWRQLDGLGVFVTADYTTQRENGAPAVSGGVNDRAAFGTFGNALLPQCTAVSINPGFPQRGPPSFPPPGIGVDGAEGCYGPDSIPGAYVAEGTYPAFADLDAWGSSAELTWSIGEWGTLRSHRLPRNPPAGLPRRRQHARQHSGHPGVARPHAVQRGASAQRTCPRTANPLADRPLPVSGIRVPAHRCDHPERRPR